MAGPPRSSSAAPWLIGCGCLGAAGLLVLVVVVVGVGIVLSSDRTAGGPTTRGGSSAGAEGGQDDLLRAFRAERARLERLAARLEGNPVAPLVIDRRAIRRLDERARSPHLNDFSAQTLAQEARRHRRGLERHIAAARKRRDNRSGTLAERLVDQAGRGFIDVRWDAGKACGASERKGWRTTACVKKGDSLTVHLLPDREFSSTWERRMIVVHELAHVYQRADRSRFESYRGTADRLVKRGLFQGSDEKMADCYALTHEGQWSLSRGNVEIGYGYVCDRAERRAIRRWAAELDAPMPG